VAGSDQRTSDLRDALARTQREVLALVKRNRAAAAPAPLPVPAPPGASEVPLDTVTSHPQVPEARTPSPGSGGTPVRREGGGRTTASRAVAQLHAEMADLAAREPDATVEISWRVVQP
jgi:hypothetical protein